LSESHPVTRKKAKLGRVMVKSKVEIPMKIRINERLSTIRLTNCPKVRVIALFAPSIATPEIYCGDFCNCHLGEFFEILRIYSVDIIASRRAKKPTIFFIIRALARVFPVKSKALMRDNQIIIFSKGSPPSAGIRNTKSNAAGIGVDEIALSPKEVTMPISKIPIKSNNEITN
jgi:hypothetical protein